MSYDVINAIAETYHCYASVHPNYEWSWDCAGFEGANFFRQEAQQAHGVSLQALPPVGDIYPVVTKFIPGSAPTPGPGVIDGFYNPVIVLLPSFFLLHELAHRFLPVWAISLYHFCKTLIPW